jgi:hypothetical protein
MEAQWKLLAVLLLLKLKLLLLLLLLQRSRLWQGHYYW